MKRFVCAVLVTVFSFAAAGQDDPWKILEPHFTVPAKFRGDFGTYSSPMKPGIDWETRRAELLAEWTDRLGKWPELNENPQVEILETTRRKGESFDQHKIRFDWLPDRPTTAYLLVPDSAKDGGKHPGIVTVYYEPETAIGLGNEQRDFALQLARKGFVALSIGTSETTNNRTYALYYPTRENAKLEPLSALACAGANAWHVLAARPEVDAERIGVTGHSYGGKWAMFAGCLWEKFAAVAVSDPGIMFDTHPSVNYWEPWYLGYHPKPWRKRGLITSENPARGLYPKLRKDGRDLHELHVLMAPRPLLVSGGSEDPPSRWEALNHTVAVNELLGHKHRVGMTNRP
ncbi:MAG: sialidase, partial [Verrucomicrobiales bacterium]|nr:sialidase [Verrucomicrobiales bacterium]